MTAGCSTSVKVQYVPSETSQFPRSGGYTFLLQEVRLSATWPLSVSSRFSLAPFLKAELDFEQEADFSVAP